MKQLGINDIRKIEDKIIDCIYNDLLKGRLDQKNQQLHTILIIIVSVFSACCIILMVYMLMFPASSSFPPPGGGPGQGSTPDQGKQNKLVPPLLKRNSQILEDNV